MHPFLKMFGARVRPKWLSAGIALCSVAVLAGCGTGHPMKIALTELGTTSESEYGAYDMRMLRALNITGLGPEEVVGTMTNDPDKWDINEQLARIFLTRKDLPDSMSIRLTRGDSRIVERSFCRPAAVTDQYCGESTKLGKICTPIPLGAAPCASPVSLSDLTQLRDSIQTTQLQMSEAAKLALRQEILKGASAALADKPSETAQAEILASISALYPTEKLDSAKSVNEALQKATLPVEAGLEAQLQKTQKILSKSGIIVTNWERQVEVSGSASATDDLTAGGSHKTTRGGFLILGDPRIVSLQLGDDLLARRVDKETAPNGSETLFTTHRNYVTHYQLRAKYIVFAENLSDVRNFNVQADLAGLVATLAPALKAKIDLGALKLKVNAIYAAVMGAAESGVLDASKGYVRAYKFSMKRDEIEASVEAEMARSADTVPIISIRSSLDDFIKRAKLPANN